MILTLSLAMMLWQSSFAQPQLDGRYGVDRVAMEKAAQQATKPSPQITAVRAVEEEYIAGKCFNTLPEEGDVFRADKYDTNCTIVRKRYSCPAESDIGPLKNRKGEHWCLKIEETKQ